MLNENGECIVENLTVGRKGKAISCIFFVSNDQKILVFQMAQRWSKSVSTYIYLFYKGYGSVFFPGEVNLTNMNLDEIVHFRRKEIIVYPDDKEKPSIGEGLNRYMLLNNSNRLLLNSIFLVGLLYVAQSKMQTGGGDSRWCLAQ